ncbi:MAG: NAD-dependent DNA ligase LigA, partial [Clostridia bacterium]|nr:NAD-dependent DNA ligase LigA [Clostridia bacterium]
KVCKDIDEVIKEINNIDKQKSTLDFLIDGAVVKINNIEKRDVIGYTAKFPKWAMAFKYEAEEMSTILKDVIWQVGRTGKITPIAIVEPVELAGATIKKATMNNFNDIRRKGVKINSRVFIRRSNEVIPEILGVAEDYQNSIEIEKPIYCPCCHSQLTEIGANLFCTNTHSCKNQVVARISHFVGRDAMNIDTVSEKTIELLYDKLNVRSVADLYKVTKEQLLTLENFKDKKSDNYLNNIEKSKDIDLASFIYALGILNVGKKTAKELAKIFKTFDNFKTATMEDLIEIKDIGEVLSQSIVEYFQFEENNKIIEELFSYGVKIKELEQVKTSNVLDNKKFVLTGTLLNIT